LEGNGRGGRKCKGKKGKRRREGFGPPKKFGVAAPMPQEEVEEEKQQQQQDQGQAPTKFARRYL